MRGGGGPFGFNGSRGIDDSRRSYRMLSWAAMHSSSSSIGDSGDTTTCPPPSRSESISAMILAKELLKFVRTPGPRTSVSVRDGRPPTATAMLGRDGERIAMAWPTAGHRASNAAASKGPKTVHHMGFTTRGSTRTRKDPQRPLSSSARERMSGGRHGGGANNAMMMGPP